MKTEIKNYFDNLTFGGSQNHRNISVLPLLTPVNGTPNYIALADAMDTKTLVVTEVSESGSVPQLLVLNDCDKPVLIIDGEELLGAKQNRILNTSILLKERSRTVVPVSCTEQGRWTYASAQFAMSEAVLERKIRSRKSASVSESLAQCCAPQSNQGEVWHGIEALHAKANTHSPTSAMNDVFKAQAERLKQCLGAFTRSEGQVGLLVLINGQVVGLDIVSRPEVYARLHEKLVRSYVLDALLEEPPSACCVNEAPTRARAFLTSLQETTQAVFPSVGYGRDYRFRAPSLAGSALMHDDHVIHASFLTLDPLATQPTDQASMSSLHRRRRFRQNPN
jgi:hypothetical protein